MSRRSKRNAAKILNLVMSDDDLEILRRLRIKRGRDGIALTMSEAIRLAIRIAAEETEAKAA